MNLETPAPCTSCFSNPKGMAFHSYGPKCCEFQTTGYPRGERTKQLALQSKRDFFFPVWCHTILLVTFLCPDIVIRIYFQGRLGYVVFILMDVCSVKNSVTMKGGKNEYWGATVYSVPLLSNCLREYLSCLVDTSGNVLWLFLQLAFSQFARVQPQSYVLLLRKTL